MSVLALQSEIMGYGVRILSVLADMLETNVTIVVQDQNRKRGFVPEDDEQLKFLPRSKQTPESLMELYHKTKPSLIYVAGWWDPDYLRVCKQAKADGVPTCTGLDNQWQGTLRQRVACLLARARVLRYFSHVHICGVRQYEFARRLGFQENQILFDVYSCDMHTFAAPKREMRTAERRRFLFVGRFAPVKGLQELHAAWASLTSKGDIGWDLQIVGGGDDAPDFGSLPNVIMSGYLSPTELAEQVKQTDVFVLPSRKEPWGVVVHEFAAGGLPLILSRACGAGTTFLIEQYNGRWFDTGDAKHLEEVMKWMIAQPDTALHQMGLRSQQLAQRITPEMSAAHLAAIVNT